jgi:hypothetical protein
MIDTTLEIIYTDKIVFLQTNDFYTDKFYAYANKMALVSIHFIFSDASNRQLTAIRPLDGTVNSLDVAWQR